VTTCAYWVTWTTYNNVLNSATGYITPKDTLAGRQQEIHAERDRNLEAARKQQQIVGSKALDVQIVMCCTPPLMVNGPVQSHLAAGGRRLTFRFGGHTAMLVNATASERSRPLGGGRFA
jgi:hypothetical protein